MKSNLLRTLISLVTALTLTACGQDKSSDTQEYCTLIGYYNPDQITVTIPISPPNQYKITSSLGHSYNSCTQETFGIFPKNDSYSPHISFVEDGSYGLNLPDQVSYTIEDLGFCGDDTDDSTISTYENLSLIWLSRGPIDYDPCYEPVIQRLAYIYLYL